MDLLKLQAPNCAKGNGLLMELRLKKLQMSSILNKFFAIIDVKLAEKFTMRNTLPTNVVNQASNDKLRVC